MIAALLWPFRKALAWAGAAFVILGGAWLAGRRDATQAETVKDLKAEAKGHDMRNEVENRIATERDARKRLRDEWSE